MSLASGSLASGNLASNNLAAGSFYGSGETPVPPLGDTWNEMGAAGTIWDDLNTTTWDSLEP